MIARLKGILDAVGDDGMIVDVQGVGYWVQASTRTIQNLPPVGTAIALYIETQVREDAITLFGFVNPMEQSWFRLLTTVQGVGSKAALAILSVLAPDDMLAVLLSGDQKAICRANGVGPKLASRIVTELKEKAAKLSPPYVADVFAGNMDAMPPHPSPAMESDDMLDGISAHSATQHTEDTKPPAPKTKGNAKAAAAAARAQVMEDALSALVNLGYGRSEVYAILADILRTEVLPVETLITRALQALGKDNL
jgi:Holliday junction DNA helicase RuvA